MSNLVPTADIERIVGVRRHPTEHYARAVSVKAVVYVLHSQECFDSGLDLRKCEFSLALDKGIEVERWVHNEDIPVVALIERGRLVPAGGRS